MKIIILSIFISLSAWGWTLERVRLTNAGADQIDGPTFRVSFTLFNSGPSMMDDLYIDVREVYRTPNCGIQNWRKSGCSRPIFRKDERIYPKRGKNYSFDWIVNQDLTNYMVFRFVHKGRKKDKFEMIRIFDDNRCRPFKRELGPGLGMEFRQSIVGENVQSNVYDRAWVHQYDFIDNVSKKDFIIEYYQKGRNSKWIPMEYLAGIRAIVPNVPGDNIYPFIKKTPLTLYRYNALFGIEHNPILGVDRQKMIIKDKKGRSLYYEINCTL